VERTVTGAFPPWTPGGPGSGICNHAGVDEGAEVEVDSTATTGPDQRKAMRTVTRQAWSVGIATGAYGISFGAVSVAAGLNVWQTVALSTLMFTGGSQFALVGVVAAGGSGVAAVATSTLLGIRNGLYSLQVARILQVRGLRRLAAAHLTIDESTAVAIGQTERPAMRRGFWLTGLLVFAGWNLTTLAGALLGNAIGDPKVYGFDAAAAAAFCALLWPRLKTVNAGATAALAALLTVVLVPVVPAGVPVLVAASAAVVVGLFARSRPVDRDVENRSAGAAEEEPA
jgi:predicted branched-subunit amino acid permease